jgi:hypothetical protein
MNVKVYQQISRSLQAMLNCVDMGKTEWQTRHMQCILQIVKSTAPSGSGIDCGTVIDLDNSKPDRIVLVCQFHHMDNGFYNGWTSHNIIITPALDNDFNLRITNRDRNQIKEYLTEIYSEWLNETIVYEGNKFIPERWRKKSELEYVI